VVGEGSQVRLQYQTEQGKRKGVGGKDYSTGTYRAKCTAPGRAETLLEPKEWRRLQCSKRFWIQALVNGGEFRGTGF